MHVADVKPLTQVIHW